MVSERSCVCVSCRERSCGGTEGGGWDGGAEFQRLQQKAKSKGQKIANKSHDSGPWWCLPSVSLCPVHAWWWTSPSMRASVTPNSPWNQHRGVPGSPLWVPSQSIVFVCPPKHVSIHRHMGTHAHMFIHTWLVLSSSLDSAVSFSDRWGTGCGRRYIWLSVLTHCPPVHH